MTIFELVKGGVTPAQAVEIYGLKVTRDNRQPGSGRCCCPFHNDHHPSMKLNDDYFYCFACHESGDVTKLTAQLLGLSQYNAARKLANDFQLNINFTPVGNQTPAPRSKHLKERDALKELSRLLVHLKSIKLESAPLNPDEDFDDRYIQACLMTESVQYLVDTLSFGMADDPYIAEKMCREAEGILLWAFEGLQRLVKNNYRFTERQKARENRNNVIPFMESAGYIRLDKEGSVSSAELYQIYCLWCQENAFTPLKQRGFSDYLVANQQKYGITHDNNQLNSAGRRVWGFKGIAPVIRLQAQYTPNITPEGWTAVHDRDNPFV